MAKKRQYINGKEFTRKMFEFHDLVQEAKKNEQELPRLPDDLWIAFYTITDNLLNSAKFSRVPLKDRDDLLEEGVKSAIKVLYNSFDPSKIQSGNAFSFTTQTIKWGILAGIQKSKKEFDNRNKVLKLYMNGQVAVNSDSNVDMDQHFITKSLDPLREHLDEYLMTTEQDEELDYAKKYDERRRQEYREKMNRLKKERKEKCQNSDKNQLDLF